MPVFYDTNILLELTRDLSGLDKARKLVNPKLEPEYTSIVCSAELRSLATRRRWGPSKLENIDKQFLNINVIDVDSALVNRYVEIDVFSQENMAQHATPVKSSRVMGKNDLWIATTASLLRIRLITVDKDYDHLNGIYLTIERLDPLIFLTVK